MVENKKDNQKVENGHGARMSFIEHLTELRRRLIICSIAVGVGFGISYYFSKPIFEVMMLPLLKVLPQGEKLIYTSLPEAFIIYIKVGLWGGIILASPVIFHQLWGFVAPGLYRHERRYMSPFIVFATLLFLTGGLFGYFVVFPYGFHYLVSFADENIRILPSVREYFSFALKMLFAFGIAFEMPLILVFMAKMGLVNARMLTKGRKYAILIIFIAAAILTPGPDVISQLCMAAPLLVLYEISILLVRMVRKQKEQKAAAVSDQAAKA
ncbi:MAG: twin-arginine translocase subunit TatC [Pseudomonadota bacterium]